LATKLELDGIGWTTVRRGAAGIAATVAMALACAGSASAATYTPTTFADDAPGSLRAAVEAATASSEDDVIVLAAGTYTLNPEHIAIFAEGPNAGKLTIRGAGARATTIDANADEQNDGFALGFREIDADVEDLAITGGANNGNGGAINVDGSDGVPDADVTLTRVRVHGNTATVRGGAIANDGKLKLDQSLVDGNAAESHGGAIDNGDELTLVNTTISGNESGGNGGGVYNTGAAGGDEEDDESFVRADNGTIAFNTATGNGGGVATADRCDVFPWECEVSALLQSHSGASSIARFHNSIVSDNTADGDTNCSGNAPADSGAHTSSEGHNLEDGDSCLFTAEGDKDEASGLAPLADNGGPTNTHKLNDGSAAIDAADAEGCPAVDQRGTTRPQRTACDIGAFEREADPKQEDPPAQQQEVPPQQTPEARGPRCLDTQPPLTTLDRDGLRVTSTTVTLSGVSRDRGRPCASGVQRIEVSMAKVSGTDLNCRFQRSSNRFLLSPFQNCRQPIRFVADGTTQWQFRFRVALRPGKYRAQARGYDQERNKETPKKRQNIVTFTVK